MTSINLQEWIAHPGLLNRDTLYELRNVLARYPYFQTVRLLYLKNLYMLHDIAFGQELRKAALYVADRRILFYLIEGENFIIRARAKESVLSLDGEPGLDRTLSLIDAFLSSIPEESAKSATLDISTDYTAYLLGQEPAGMKKDDEAPRMVGQDLIDGFIEKSDSSVSLRIEPSDENSTGISLSALPEENAEDDENCFTETLAKIYIKQRRYSKALEIIKKLSLKYPKKNAYFADQIRFLEKLIINTKSK